LIRGAFAHLPGIGPERLRRLRVAGVNDWRALLEDPGLLHMGPARLDRLRDAVQRCEEAVQRNDIGYLVSRFKQQDRWRILGTWFECATFFDIETSGLDWDSEVTMVACLHRGQLHSFLKGESLDAFLDLLDDVDLLVSFNGTSFDVPRIEDAFHIPDCPCPHVDLRWLCYHASLSGGLKSIETQVGIRRPDDLLTIDGEQAGWLWNMWEQDGDRKARRVLERYCGADVLALQLLAAHLLDLNGCKVESETADELWNKLPEPEVADAQPKVAELVTRSDEPEVETERDLSPLEKRLRASRSRRRGGRG
jgi:uncharacterized protein YprB with RNaseH-like and TPR domain